jgi:hypothetical protein
MNWNLTMTEVLNCLGLGFMRGLLLVGLLLAYRAIRHATRERLRPCRRRRQVRDMRRSCNQ